MGEEGRLPAPLGLDLEEIKDSPFFELLNNIKKEINLDSARLGGGGGGGMSWNFEENVGTGW